MSSPVSSPRADRLTVIGVMGGSKATPEQERAAEAVGRRIAERGWALLCGGGGGVMRAAARGAFQAGGLTIGVLPGRRASDANPYIRLPIVTGLGDARNAVNALSSRVIVAVGGAGGTLSEIALALKNGVPVIGLTTCRFAFADGAAPPHYYEARDLDHALEMLDALLHAP